MDTGDRFEPVRVRVTPSDVDAFLFERELARGGYYPRTPGAESVLVSLQKTCVTFLASDDLMEKFEQVKALLSNRTADATFADVLEVLLDEYIERHSPHARQKRREARKAAAAPSPTGGKSSTVGADGNFHGSSGSEQQPSRHIPASVRDEVFIRDRGQCTSIAPNGTRVVSLSPRPDRPHSAVCRRRHARPRQPETSVRRTQSIGGRADPGCSCNESLLAAPVRESMT